MFDLGWTELLVIGIVALIVVGPKDLPMLFRNIGRFVGKAKGMAREFSKAMNDAADESGMKDVQKTFKAASNPLNSAMDGVKSAAKDMTNLDLDSTKPAKKADVAKPSPERAEAAKKIEAATARKAAERKAREAEEAMKAADALEAKLGSDDGDKA
ncbi:Sec-independent protein translocase protein TatB [Roseivivax sp. THAF40]|uniref:Sec-independent protein translocase protein TatB n=1 Tax=unclassified Roseivivax TaxID=2639302 RepID=UPI001268EAA2|nr:MULTISPECIES: Sec-independent protein translocase protein TatB [unclassified Roseivivax]QFS82670.1 Sec-independent protein translocase protein TatB [Roseivivax sp. THAF197b]QFT46439.1 Sec-independent protein translocase protein TatB [Roseivivax sp. THAF40]